MSRQTLGRFPLNAFLWRTASTSTPARFDRIFSPLFRLVFFPAPAPALAPAAAAAALLILLMLPPVLLLLLRQPSLLLLLVLLHPHLPRLESLERKDEKGANRRMGPTTDPPTSCCSFAAGHFAQISRRAGLRLDDSVACRKLESFIVDEDIQMKETRDVRDGDTEKRRCIQIGLIRRHDLSASRTGTSQLNLKSLA